VGIITAPGEIEGQSKSMKVLEIKEVIISGRKVLLTMNTEKAMYRILQLLDSSVAIDKILPGVSYDPNTRRFTYLPPMIPLNVGEEVETFRTAMFLLSRAA